MSNQNAIISLVVFVLVVLGALYFANQYQGGGMGSLNSTANIGTTNDFYNGTTTGSTGGSSATTTGSTGGATSGSLATSAAALSARAILASRLNTSTANITVSGVEAVDWPNGCLGLARSGEVCTQVITPGYRVILTSGGKEYIYRTNSTGAVVRLQS